MEQFLSYVQNSGYRMAQLATANTDDALELVQESMLQLVKRYKGKPDNELRILFILYYPLASLTGIVKRLLENNLKRFLVQKVIWKTIQFNSYLQINS